MASFHRYGKAGMFHAGQLAAANTSFVSARDAVVARVEQTAQSAATLKARRQSNKLLLRALKAWKRGETIPAAQLSLEATNADDTNAQAFHLLAITLEKLGHLHKALVTYEKAYQLEPNDPDLILNLGLTAWNTGNMAAAERLFRLYIETRPDKPEGYNNLASVLRDKGDIDQAIETVRGAIYRIPDQPMLWNTLATVLSEDGRVEEGLVFYEEALRLDPNFARAWHNLGYSYVHLGRCEESLAAYNSALALSTNHHERIEALHSRSICLMAMGKVEEGFSEYEVRNHREFRTFVLHHTKAPRWNGEPLEGKRVLLVGEQGLGDEVMFANVLPDIARSVGEKGKLQIAVDARLIPIFKRSFPLADIGRYAPPQDRWAGSSDLPVGADRWGAGLLRVLRHAAPYPAQDAVRFPEAEISRGRCGKDRAIPQPALGARTRSLCRDLLAFDGARRQAAQIFQRHRRLGAHSVDAGCHLRQPAIWRCERGAGHRAGETRRDDPQFRRSPISGRSTAPRRRRRPASRALGTNRGPLRGRSSGQ
jgi:tetratricopeptide (TPR) repeat protein